ncbi:MAG TPA: DNA polymerase III subunit gamma/tau, partial [Burkholderiales bacterium]|nr:DNA polymerase III subunit gamma/tau [Burkholderiales bacterium]
MTLALARKWRPKNFTELVGQEHVVRAISNALSQNRLHHAYLLTGTRGVGKTTLARIIAKALNCETGITATPCGKCAACVEIDGGRFVDLIELDAASNTQVDNMRELLENALYSPASGRFKVYIIDEVHMLSRSAFNAMLKTLEEPPAHVKFILATTDPQKIPVTVLSRCLQFNLKQIPLPQIRGQLENVLGKEGVPFDVPALNLLARAAQGSMRDALSLLDQAIAHGAGRVEEAAVRDMLGAVDRGYLFAILHALTRSDGPGLLAEAERMSARSLSLETALQDLATLLHRIALAQTVPDALASDEPERDALIALAGKFAPEDVQLLYQIAIRGRDELGLAPDEFAGFTMTLMRMLAFVPVEAAGSVPTGVSNRP